MGCWNATCGISNLPIMVGERVVTFICKIRHLEPRPSYSDTLCTPIYFHLKGEYDDYGSIQNIDGDKCTNDMLNFINKKYNTSFENIESCVKSISSDEIDGLFLFMIKEDLFNTLINEMGNRKPYKRKFTNRQAQLSRIKKIQKLRIKLNKIEKNDISYIINQHKINNIEGNMFRDFSSFIRYSENKIHVDYVLEYVLFQMVMEGLRKSFVPMSGCGSQSYEMYLHKLVGEYMIKTEHDLVSESDGYDQYLDIDDWYKSENALPSKETSFWY